MTWCKVISVIAGSGEVQLAHWSPTSSYLAMVVDHQLYLVDALRMEKMVKVEDSPGRSQGLANLLYEGSVQVDKELLFIEHMLEKIWGDKKGSWFSADGTKLAFAVFEYEDSSSSCHQENPFNSLPQVSE